MIRRIHVTYHLKTDGDSTEAIDRVHEVHAEHCPVYRTVHRCIDVTTEWVSE